ncbi:putative glycosyltransferase [Arthrobacter globiformis NBRC 12137]|uniref:Putative glycosyltransferase n=1 Tax=Arthrobacter globiformis (strain ATCC 8010 / DSM 20124 / JCM 1332 / NBRC 12137 / NCIMB 8907 / NRRL B-2979 / 168) TaxID=1077972 RepID=H0QRT5_ARTG1|nr:glycosyltransferase family A protein [Arthrobacter globiformis]GAB15421.1 putative glycosyltransferase [Arthrobacter globiformis NBRC 12137]
MSQSIEVVIPVHDVQRPFKRAVGSALEQRAELSRLGVELRVTVVLHNLGAAAGEVSKGPQAGSESAASTALDGVTWLTCDDGVRSPAGPRNRALDESTATFLSFLDSDDHLEPGSLAAWWKAAQPDSASAVIAPLRTPEGTILPAPASGPLSPPSWMPSRTDWPTGACRTGCSAGQCSQTSVSGTRRGCGPARTSRPP